VSVVNALRRRTFRVAFGRLLVDETSLPTDLSGDLEGGRRVNKAERGKERREERTSL
jgi:hypothetical protein